MGTNRDCAKGWANLPSLRSGKRFGLTNLCVMRVSGVFVIWKWSSHWTWLTSLFSVQTRDDIPGGTDTSMPQAVLSPDATASLTGLAAAMQPFRLARMMLHFGDLLHFEVLYDLLGDGTFGMVHTVRKEDRRIVSVKTAIQPDDLSGLVAEAMLLASSSHARVLYLLDAHAYGGYARLVLPCHGNNLAMAVHSAISFQVPCITRQSSDALHYVHSKDLAHNDVELANLGFEPNDAGVLVVLGDFGQALMQNVHRMPLNEIMAKGVLQGTLQYRAPEISLGDAAYGQPADIWATGCILGELAARRPMFAADCALHTLSAILKLLGLPLATDLVVFAALPHWSPSFWLSLSIRVAATVDLVMLRCAP